MVNALTADDPQQVGPYRITARLGAGGMGNVYLASSSGGRQVAVKVIRPELADEPGFRERFAREASAAQAVSGAFTAAVVGADPHGRTPWLATLYVPGLSLSEAVVRHGTLPVSSVCALGAGLAEALQAIHAAGLVHRDLKPSNVLLASDGPRVIDFGIAREQGADALTGTGHIIGTPGFMAPEQFTGRPVGPAADVFCLGAVLTFAGTGNGPFGSGSSHAMGFRVVHEEPDLGPLPEPVRAVVARCLAKDPGARPAVPELLHELAGLVASGPAAEPEEPTAADDRTLAVALKRSPWLPLPLADAVGIADAAPSSTTPSPTTPTAAAGSVGRAAPVPMPPPPTYVPTQPALVRDVVPGAPTPPGPRDATSPSAPGGRPGWVRRHGTKVLVGGLLVGVIGYLTPRVGPFASDHDGGAKSSPSAGAGASADTGPECAAGSQGVQGSGSPAQNRAMDEWIKGYQAACPATTINYQPVGSGAGVADFAKGTIDFAGSGLPVTPEGNADVCQGAPVNLPVLGNPVALVYNLPGVDSLALDAPTIARIYDSKISKWDDAAIRKLNPGVTLPSAAIRAFHRSDLSDSTLTLNSYLGANAAAEWPYKPGTQWPAPGGHAVAGSSGVSEQVSRQPGAIGYVDLSDAEAATIDIDTGHGKPVEATAANASRGLATAAVAGKGKDLSLDLDYAPDAEAAYPLVSATYEVVCATARTGALKPFLTYIAGEQGQDALESLGYARLPAPLAARVRKSVASITSTT